MAAIISGVIVAASLGFVGGMQVNKGTSAQQTPGAGGQGQMMPPGGSQGQPQGKRNTGDTTNQS